MFLRDYIDTYNDDLNVAFEKLGTKFQVSPRTVASWYYFERFPSAENARVIVRKTKGEVDYEGIFAPYPGA